jgi:hypothetical protein
MLLVRIFKKIYFVLVFLEIITVLGLKSPFSVVSIYAESSFFYISKKFKLKIVLFMSIYIP